MYTKEELLGIALSEEQIDALDTVMNIVEEEQMNAGSQEIWNTLERVRDKIKDMADQTKVSVIHRFQTEDEIIQETLDRR